MLAALLGLVSEAAKPQAGPSYNLPTLEDSFPKQWEWETAEDRLMLVMTGRQAGKTRSSRRRALRRLVTRPGHKYLYMTMTRKNTRKFFWEPLKEDLYARGIPFTANNTDLRLKLNNGSLVEATSGDDAATIQKVRGDNWDDVEVDEAQAYPDEILKDLVENIIFPMLMTRGGTLTLKGTPPDAIMGYFVDRLKDPKWRWFNWSIFDNRFIPRAQIEQVISDLGLQEGSNQYQREILGLPVKDPTKLVFEYDEELNSYEAGSIDFTKPGWRFAAGLDLGWSDLTSLHVVAWRADDPEQKLYEVENWTMANATLDHTEPQVARVKRQYKPRRWVGDNGGHGATTLLETLAARLKLVFEKKPGTGELIPSIGMVNTDLRRGRVKLIRGGETANDTGKVIWSFNAQGKREPNKKGFHSDRLDSFRYAHHAARHFLGKAPPKTKTLDEQRDEWLSAKEKAAATGEF